MVPPLSVDDFNVWATPFTLSVDDFKVWAPLYQLMNLRCGFPWAPPFTLSADEFKLWAPPFVLSDPPFVLSDVAFKLWAPLPIYYTLTSMPQMRRALTWGQFRWNTWYLTITVLQCYYYNGNITMIVLSFLVELGRISIYF